MPSPYNIGDRVDLSATFTTIAGDSLTNPTTVVFTIHKPDGSTSTPAVANTSTGVFVASVSVDQSGTWKWRAVGTGAVEKAQDGSFYVEPNTF